jgi:hypothetical protein
MFGVESIWAETDEGFAKRSTAANELPRAAMWGAPLR